MSTPAEHLFSREIRLLDAFELITNMKAEHKKQGQSIAEAIDEQCQALGMAPKAFKAALAYYNLTDGERNDLDEAIQAARRATQDRATGDLFDKELETSLQRSVVQFERRRVRGNEEGNSPTTS